MTAMTTKWMILFITLFIGFGNYQSVQDQQTDFQEKMLLEINALRATGCKCGATKMPPVKPLQWNAVLELAAQRHADDMLKHKRMSHTGSNGSDPAKRVTKAGYEWSAVAENIAQGYKSVEEVVAGWQKSPGHCRNMMKATYTEIGAARSGDYWVQNFAKPKAKR
jgi:uncharacterized protein YkwD